MAAQKANDRRASHNGFSTCIALSSPIQNARDPLAPPQLKFHRPATHCTPLSFLYSLAAQCLCARDAPRRDMWRRWMRTQVPATPTGSHGTPIRENVGRRRHREFIFLVFFRLLVLLLLKFEGKFSANKFNGILLLWWKRVDEKINRHYVVVYRKSWRNSVCICPVDAWEIFKCTVKKLHLKIQVYKYDRIIIHWLLFENSDVLNVLK